MKTSLLAATFYAMVHVSTFGQEIPAQADLFFKIRMDRHIAIFATAIVIRLDRRDLFGINHREWNFADRPECAPIR